MLLLERKPSRSAELRGCERVRLRLSYFSLEPPHTHERYGFHGQKGGSAREVVWYKTPKFRGFNGLDLADSIVHAVELEI